MLLSAAALVTAVPVAVWGLMGQQNADAVPPSELDYAYQPFDVADGTAAVIGAVALLLAGAGAALLVRATRRGTLDRRWWEVLAPLMAVGLIVGVGWRIVTAGVVGANIGAGLTIFAGGPVVAALLLWSLIRGVQLATRRGDDGDRTGIGFAPHGA
jgi:hypothetical protein